jgi:hypothetical protein
MGEDHHGHVDVAARRLDAEIRPVVDTAKAGLGDDPAVVAPVQVLGRDRRREGVPPDPVVVPRAVTAVEHAAERAVFEDAVLGEGRERVVHAAGVLGFEMAAKQLGECLGSHARPPS